MPTMPFTKSLAAGETIDSVFIGNNYYTLMRPAMVQVAAVATAGLAADIALTTYSVNVGGAVLAQEGQVTDKSTATPNTVQVPWDFLVQDQAPAGVPVIVAVKNGGAAAVGVQIVVLLTWL